MRNETKQTPNEAERNPAPRMRRGGMGGHGGPAGGTGEKAKNFGKTMKKLIAYMGRYKWGILTVLIFAVASTVFQVVGPKILGRATTEIFTGLTGKLSGGPGIDFSFNPAGALRHKFPVQLYSGPYHDDHFPEGQLPHEERNVGEDQPAAHELL